MNNQKKSKYNIDDFLDKNIIDELKDYLEEIDNTISISKNDYKYSALLNLIDIFWYRVNYILSVFHEIKNIDNKEWKFHLFILYCTNIVGGIKNIKTFINKKIDNNFKVDIEHKNIFCEDVKLFLENEIEDTKYKNNIKENNKLEKYLTDKWIFEFIRSIVIAHPLDTNRHFKSSFEYFENLISPYFYIDEHIFNAESYEEKITLVIFTTDLKDNKINFPLNGRKLNFHINFSNLKKYVKEWYLEIPKIKNWLIEYINNDFFIPLKAKILELKGNEKEEILNKLIEIFEDYTGEVPDDLDEFQKEIKFVKENKIFHIENIEKINKYFEFKFEILNKKINDIEEIENCQYIIESLCSFFSEEKNFERKVTRKNKDILCSFREYNKHFDINWNRKKDSLNHKDYKEFNIEWGLEHAANIYEKFANKYVYMDIWNTNLLFLEIKLLIKVALFLNY